MMSAADPVAPPRVAVIGGGRWARVLADVVCDVAPPSTAVSVHSRHNAESMRAWAASRTPRRVGVSAEWPAGVAGETTAVIVANAARDHAAAAKWAIERGMPTLVEKPLTPVTDDAERIVALAEARGTFLGAAHVLLFARYLERFADAVADVGGASRVRVTWTDPAGESRYGEQKRYDAGVPVFVDILPHVMSVLSMIVPVVPDTCAGVRVRHGGARVELTLAGVVPCEAEVVRNSDRRRRIVEVLAERGETLVLDFSQEPGTITRGTVPRSADPAWDADGRPAPHLVAAFLRAAAGAPADPRLGTALALHTCRVADQAFGQYRSSVAAWLDARLTGGDAQDDDVRYALTELSRSGDAPSAPALGRRAAEAVRQFSKTQT